MNNQTLTRVVEYEDGTFGVQERSIYGEGWQDYGTFCRYKTEKEAKTALAKRTVKRICE